MDISVIVPLFNEAESLPELYAWIQRVMNENKFSYEVIFINDGSTDNSWQVIQELKAMVNHLPCSVVLIAQRVMWLSLWMPICKIRQMRYLNCIVW